MLLEKGQSQAAAILLITLLSFSYMYLASAQDANNSEQPNQEIPQEQLPDQNASQQPTTEATVQEQAAQDQNILQEATQEQPADQNVLQEPAQDQNASEQPTRQPVQPTSIEIVSPLEAQEVFGETIIVTAVSDENTVVSAWYSINSLDENISYSLDSNLSAVLHFNASWDSTQAQNGSYLLEVFACSTESCSTDSAGFYVNNPSMPVEEPEEQAQTVSVNASNIESVVSLSDSNANLVASGFQGITVPMGQYNAAFTFIHPLLSSAEMQNALIDSNTTLLEVYNIPSIFTANSLRLKGLLALKPNVSFGSASVQIESPKSSDAAYECSNFDFSLLSCNSDWVFLKELEPETTSLEILQAKAFAFSDLNIELPGSEEEGRGKGGKPKDQNKLQDLNILQDQNILQDLNAAKDQNALDQNALQKKHSLLLKPKKKSFRADEQAEFLFEIKNPQGEAFDSNLSAYLLAPDNQMIKISPENIKWLEKGLFSLLLPPMRSMKAGEYAITVELSDFPGLSSTDYFSWGVVAVNSYKSIYKPGETAEFEIVVLDNKSFPVCDAQIVQTIIAPSGTAIALSTNAGTIVPTNDCGVYYSSYQVQEEGDYNVLVAATAKGVENSIETSFKVNWNYEFDVLRTTKTKIDPTKQPYSVQIDIISFSDANSVTLKEFVPAEFEITDTNALVETDANSNAKILSWELALESGKTSASYSYSVPMKYPWLYYIGPAQLTYNSSSFLEARAWMIAVDANLSEGEEYYALCNSLKCFYINKKNGAQYTETPNDPWSENTLGLSFDCDSDGKSKKKYFAGDLGWEWQEISTEGTAQLLGLTQVKFKNYKYDLNVLYSLYDGSYQLEITYSLQEAAGKDCADLNFLHKVDRISIAGASGSNAELEFVKAWGFPEVHGLDESFGYDWNALGDRRFTWRNKSTGQFMEDYWVSDGLKEGGWWQIEPSFNHDNKTLFSIKVGSLAANQSFSLSHLWFDANLAGYGYDLGGNIAPYLGNAAIQSGGRVLQTRADTSRKKLWVLANDLNGTPNLLLLQYNMDSNTITNLTPLMKRPRCRDDYNATCASVLPLTLQNRSWSMDFDGNNLWIGFNRSNAVFVYLPDLEQFYWLNKEFSEIELGEGGTSGWGSNNYVVGCGNTHCYLSANNAASPQFAKFARIQKNFLGGNFNHNSSIEDLNDYINTSGQNPNWDTNCNVCIVYDLLVEDTNHTVYVGGQYGSGNGMPLFAYFFEDSNRTVMNQDINKIFLPKSGTGSKYREVNEMVFDKNANIYLLGSWDWGAILGGQRHFAQYDRNLLTLKDFNNFLQSRAAVSPPGKGSCLGAIAGTQTVNLQTGFFFPIEPNNVDGNIVIGMYLGRICNFDPRISAGMMAATKWGNDWTVMGGGGQSVYASEFASDQNIYFAGGSGGTLGFHTYSNSEIYPEWLDGNAAASYAFQETDFRAAPSCWKGWCGDSNFLLQWCKGTTCNTWIDANMLAAENGIDNPLYYRQADANEDSYRFLLENPTTTWHIITQDTGTFRIRYYNDSNNADVNYSQARELTVPTGGYYKTSFFPPTERFLRQDKNQTFSIRVDCKLGNCGDTNVQLQYAYGLASNQFYDVNTSNSSQLYATNPTTVNLLQNQSADFNLSVIGQTTNWYWVGKPKIEGSLAWDWNDTTTNLYRFSCNQECLEVSTSASDINVTDGIRLWSFTQPHIWQPARLFDYNVLYGLRPQDANIADWQAWGYPAKSTTLFTGWTVLSGVNHSLDENLSVRAIVRSTDSSGNTLLSTIYPNGRIYQRFVFASAASNTEIDYLRFLDANDLKPDWNNSITDFNNNRSVAWSDLAYNNNFAGLTFTQHNFSEMSNINSCTYYGDYKDWRLGYHGFYCYADLAQQFRQMVSAHHFRTNSVDLNAQGNDYREAATVTASVGTYNYFDENLGAYIATTASNNSTLSVNTNQKIRFHPAFQFNDYTSAQFPAVYLDSVLQTLGTDYIVDLNIIPDKLVVMFLKDLNSSAVEVKIVSPADYSFVVLLPSSGCTAGKGAVSGTACAKGYFETTDLSGLADQNKVDAEGQTSAIPLFVFDNQSTAGSDLNISMDINVALPATLKLKVATNYNNWNWACNDDANYNCVLVTNSTKNIGKALYTAGTKDYNLFAWADFVSADIGQTDVNLTHRGGAA